MEHLHHVVVTRNEQLVAVGVDGATRCVRRKLCGVIVDWNPIDRMYTVDFEEAGTRRVLPGDLVISNIQDIDPPEFLPASRDRQTFFSGLARVAAAEREAEREVEEDPYDLGDARAA